MQNAVSIYILLYLAPRIPCSQLNRSFFPSYLDLSELLESPGTKKPTVQLQQQQQLSNNTTAEVTTTTAITTKSNVHETGSNEGKGGGVGSLSTSSSSSTKVGHSNKSKVMHDLFGLEESPLKTNILQKPKESTEDQSMASSNNSLR